MKVRQEVIELIQKVGLWAPAIVFILSFGVLLWVNADANDVEKVD
jgi:hypothetical protein